MENENIAPGIDKHENPNQDNISNIENFLQSISDENLRNQINDTLVSHDLTNDFESYLSDISLAKKIQLKNKLRQCDDIYKTILDCLHEKSGYQVGYHDIKNDTFILQDTKKDNQQANIDNQQANIDNQQANIDNQQANIDNQQANIDNQQTNINKKETFEEISGLKELKEAISARNKLINGYPKLAETTNQNSELYQATKSEFEKAGIIKQLQDSNHDANFIDSYILVHTTLREVKSNEKNYKDANISKFEKAVKNLDNACNIPDTKFDNFSTKNITQTRSELFNNEIGNTSLIKAKESNKSSQTHQEYYNQIFALDQDKDTEMQLIEKYGKFVEDDDLKNLIKKYETDGLSEQECDILTKGLGDIKANIDNQTKDLIEEMCLIAPIQGILSCVGLPDFTLNKSNEIKNENGKITITGHIEGINFSLYHDTTNPDARLQTSSILTKTDNNKFEIGTRYEDSPFKLPTNGDIFKIAANCIGDDIMESPQNAKEYFQLLQKNISNKFEGTLYKDAKDANNYIKDKIKGEKVTNQYLNLLGKIKGSPINGDIEQSNSKLYNFIDLINSTNYVSNISDKENMSQCLKTIQDIISTHGKTDKQTTEYPGIIRQFLMNKNILKRTKKILNGFDMPGESIFDLFGYYIEQNSGIKTINFKQLKKDLEGKEGQESIVASNWQDNIYREYLADANLDNALANIA